MSISGAATVTCAPHVIFALKSHFTNDLKYHTNWSKLMSEFINLLFEKLNYIYQTILTIRICSTQNCKVLLGLLR